MINNKDKIFKPSLLIIILILPLAWLYFHSELGNSRKAHEIESLLLEITQVETQLTEYVLKNRSHLTLHYDDISASQSRLNVLMDKFIPLLSNNMNISSKRLDNVDDLFRNMQIFIERFKSINSQISQRQRYIKVISDQIKQSIISDPHNIIEQINTITIMVFKGRIFGEPLLDQALIKEIESLTLHEKEWDLKNNELIHTFILHVNKLSELEGKEAVILNTLFQHELRGAIQVIRNNLIENKFEMVNNSNTIQRYFIIYACILLLLIVFFILNHKKIQRNAYLHKTLSEVDELTKLKNRRSFLDDLECVIEKQSGALLFIDLDGFKLVNDQLGHCVGDVALQTLADKLQTFVEEIDSLKYSAQAYRLGGDEFVISIENIVKADDFLMLKNFAAQVVRGCEFSVDEQYELSISVGISLYPEQGNDVATVLNCADKAMYHSKYNGRNRFTFYSDI